MNPLELNGRWDVEAVLGRGSFGTVVRARDRRSGSVRAIKEFEGVNSGFLRELSFVLDLNHPNIVACESVLVMGGGRYLVYEFLEQGSLRELLQGEGGRRSRVELLELLAQACAGVSYAHTHGIIHRDLKPENLLVTQRDGRSVAKVSDFGVAMLRGAQRNDGLGSPAYMAPEQFFDHCDERVDIYALGVIAYEIACGRRPFRGSVEEIVRAHMHVEPELPAWLGERWRVLLGCALAKDPERRYASVGAFEFALREALERELECLRPRSWPWSFGSLDALVLGPTSVASLRAGVLERRDREGFELERRGECDALLGAGHHLLYRQRGRWYLQTPLGRRRCEAIPAEARPALSTWGEVAWCAEGGAWQLGPQGVQTLLEPGAGARGLCFVGPRQHPWVLREGPQGVELSDGATKVPLPHAQLELLAHPRREQVLARALDGSERLFLVSRGGCIERDLPSRSWQSLGSQFVGLSPAGELLLLEPRSGALARHRGEDELVALAACRDDLCALDRAGRLHEFLSEAPAWAPGEAP